MLICFDQRDISTEAHGAERETYKGPTVCRQEADGHMPNEDRVTGGRPK